MSITVYEAKGCGGNLGSAMVGDTRYQQGTVEYLEKLMREDKRFAESLADLIESSGSKGVTFFEALKNGKVTINYDCVRAKADGSIKISRFELKSQPKVPDIKVSEAS